jgi:hypothetical protein
MAATAEASKSHMVWQCGSIAFRANFDGGNLGSAKSGAESGTFQCSLASDCAAHPGFETPYRLWYHFAVDGGTAGRTIRVNISGINHIAKIYNTDLRPLVRVVSRSGAWERLVHAVTTPSAPNMAWFVTDCSSLVALVWRTGPH